MDAALPVQAIGAFERLHNATVTVHDVRGVFLGIFPPDVLRHRHPRCLAAKRAGAETACVAFDGATLRRRWQGRGGAGLAKVCHAGLVELAVPHHDQDGTLEWVLFAGAWGEPADADARWDPLRVAITHPGQRPPAALPAQRLWDLLEALQQLAARLAAWRAAAPALDRRQRAPWAAAPVDAAGRREAILRFIADRHREAASLADLARALGLSPFRASHLVRALCGDTFRALLARARLDTAEQLLAHTALPITEVALASGHGDLSHFHAAFRARHACSPRRWRLGHGGV